MNTLQLEKILTHISEIDALLKDDAIGTYDIKADLGDFKRTVTQALKDTVWAVYLTERDLE